MYICSDRGGIGGISGEVGTPNGSASKTLPNFSVFSLCFSSLGFPPSSPFLLLAIGKKISNQKGFFWFEDFYSYRVNIKNQKYVATEKEDKKFPLFLSFTFFLVFTGKRLNHEG